MYQGTNTAQELPAKPWAACPYAVTKSMKNEIILQEITEINGRMGKAELKGWGGQELAGFM